MGIFSQLRHKFLIAPLFLLVFCACEPPKPDLKAKNKQEACSLLRESIALHNPPERPFGLFVPNENHVSRESEDKPGTALVPLNETGRNFQLFGPKGLFMEQNQQIPRTMEKFGLGKIDPDTISVTVNQPFVAEKTADGVVVKFQPDGSWDGVTRNARLRVNLVDACGAPASVNLTVVADDTNKLASLERRMDGTQFVDGRGFGTTPGDSSGAFLNGGGTTTGDGNTGLADARPAHIPPP